VVEYVVGNINIQMLGVRFMDLDDVKNFVEDLNQREGARLGFKLIVLDKKKGKRVK
jgi:hypothetical protein